MTPRRLPLSLAALWGDTDTPQFQIRYRDISEKLQNCLSKRIKETSPIITVRNSPKANLNTIHEILLEINPIIFSEGPERRGYPSNPWTRSHTKTLDGFNFRTLCRIIYLLTCRKKPLDTFNLHRAAYLTSTNWALTLNHIDTAIRVIFNTTAEPQVRDTEISLEDVTRVRLSIT